ncbi:MAG: deoxyribonuclease IV [bacterium]
MRIGVHVSIAGGIDKAPKRASDLGCECFQIFSKSPHGGDYGAKLADAIADNFKKECARYGFRDYYIHSPYYINFGSSNNRIFYGSVNAIKKELETANLIGAKYVITHLGSAKDLGEEEAFEKTIQGLKLALEGYEGKADLLIEISAGAGAIIGDSFDEIGDIIKKIKNKKIGVCFDTAHAFESGYDLRTSQRVKNVFTEFDKKIGLEKLKLIHCNDSKTDLGSRSDRHEDIGKGKIGIEGLKAVIQFAKSQRRLNVIAETPYKIDGDDKRNLEVLKGMRGE